MKVNYYAIKFEKTIPNIRKRKKKSLSCVHVTYPIKLKLGRLTSNPCSDTKQTNKQTKRALSFSFFKTEPIAFLLFSMPFADV